MINTDAPDNRVSAQFSSDMLRCELGLRGTAHARTDVFREIRNLAIGVVANQSRISQRTKIGNQLRGIHDRGLLLPELCVGNCGMKETEQQGEQNESRTANRLRHGCSASFCRHDSKTT